MTGNRLPAGLEALCEAAGTQTPESAMRGLCATVLRNLGLDEPPIPLRPLLKELQVEFHWKESSFRPGRGAASLLLLNGGMVIHLHDPKFKRRWRRTRFSIAHELAHALIIRTLGDSSLLASLEESDSAYRQLERLCNLGAAELLMPTVPSRKLLKLHGLGPEGLLRLYDSFLVSRDALLWKIATVIPRGSALRWRFHARSPAEERKFRVVASYPPVGRKGGRPWLPQGASTRHLDSDIIGETAKRQQPICTDRCFVELDYSTWECSALTSFFPSRPASTMPLFEGFAVPDESSQPSSSEVIMFLGEYGSKLPGDCRQV